MMDISRFWQYIDELVGVSEVVIDRPKGTAHPNFPDFIYPVDYGYLRGTTAIDGGGIDIWCGTARNSYIDAVICTVDPFKRDTEIKILYACTREEKQEIVRIMNVKMAGLLIEREE